MRIHIHQNLTGKSFGPPGGKKMTIFMDDLSMPEKNGYVWGNIDHYSHSMIVTQNGYI